MSELPDLLIGDAERAKASEELSRHYESGRLSLEELEQRLDQVHAARTEADVQHALRQLPSLRPTLRLRDTRWSSLALQYVLVNAIAVLVWAFSGGSGSFWPKWVLLATLITFARRAARRHEPPRPELPKE